MFGAEAAKEKNKRDKIHSMRTNACIGQCDGATSAPKVAHPGKSSTLLLLTSTSAPNRRRAPWGLIMDDLVNALQFHMHVPRSIGARM